MHVKIWSLKWRSEKGGMNIKFKLIVSYHQVKLDAGHTEDLWKPRCVCVMHILSIAVRHFPPNSARTGYVTEGALFITVQLSTNVVSALWKVWILVRLRWLHIAQAQRKHEMHPPQVQSKFCLDWNNFCFICGGVRKLSVTKLLPLEHHPNLLVGWQSFQTYGVISYGSGWRRDVVNLCLEFVCNVEDIASWVFIIQ